MLAAESTSRCHQCLLVCSIDDSVRPCLVYLCCINDVLEVFGDVDIAIVAQLLDDFEAVKKGAVVPHICLPLRDPDCVV